ncbi:Uma2 family endonuclease [Streptomyces sp. NPDC057743]|uniref:Uma2 family endonuclease n=1 Tax=Streptomyces sp. NPDC057743 TaxID=3346236 RepID=UPI0036A99B4B
MKQLTSDHYPLAGREWDALVRLWTDTDAPPGCMVEVVDGIVTVAPPRDVHQNVIAAELSRALYAVLPEDRGAYQKLAVALPARHGLYVPNLVVAPEAALRGAGRLIPAAAVELAVEITSKTSARHGRVEKRTGYASAGVPLYLLIDLWAPDEPVITLYGELADEEYRVLQAVKFGDELTLPAPFDLTVDTGVFAVVD